MFDARYLVAGNEDTFEVNENPFKMFTPDVKLSFVKITDTIHTGFATIGKTVLDSKLDFMSNKVVHIPLSETVGQTDYMDLEAVQVLVPVGLVGNLLSYTKLLTGMFTVMCHIDSEVLKPVQTALSQTLGSSREMGLVTMDRFNKEVLLHSADILQFKEELKSYYNPESSNETVSFTKCFARLKDFELFNNEINKLKDMVKKNPLGEVADDVKRISETANLMNLRLKQGKLEHLQNEQAEFITDLLVKASVEVEIYAALITMINGVFSVHENLQAHLKRITLN